MIKAAFVGGPLDQEIYDLQYLQPTVEMPVASFNDAKPINENGTFPYKFGKYEIMHNANSISSDAETVYLYIWVGETDG